MVGGSQIANVVISIIRVKLVAVMLGPTGIGLLGLFNNVKEIGGTAGGLGLATSGVRQIAQNTDDLEAQACTRRLLLISLAIQGGVTALVIWVIRGLLAEQIFGGTIEPRQLGLIAIAVWIGLIASAMTAVIQGMRRIAELVRVTVYGALIGTFLGLLAVLILRESGLPILVLALALGQLSAAIWFLRRIGPPAKSSQVALRSQIACWGGMVRLGIAFMVGTLLTVVTMLLVRSIVQERLGLNALGQFEAAWALTMTYLGFVLNAMAADYFPRLSSKINDHKVANTMVNEQIQLALILGGPLVLITIGLAPVVLTVLYSSEFSHAAPLLQIMSLGNLIKLSSWSMGFTVVAKGRSGLFMLLELLFNAVFVAFVMWQIEAFGIGAIGTAFIIAYAAHMLAASIAARSIIGFTWEKISLKLLMSYFVAAVLLLFAVRAAPIAGGIAALVVAGAGIVLGLRFLLATRGDSNPIAVRIEQAFARIGWPIQRQRTE
jgi:PST family polysaccharide transporter